MSLMRNGRLVIETIWIIKRVFVLWKRSSVSISKTRLRCEVWFDWFPYISLSSIHEIQTTLWNMGCGMDRWSFSVYLNIIKKKLQDLFSSLRTICINYVLHENKLTSGRRFNKFIVGIKKWDNFNSCVFVVRIKLCLNKLKCSLP